MAQNSTHSANVEKTKSSRTANEDGSCPDLDKSRCLWTQQNPYGKARTALPEAIVKGPLAKAVHMARYSSIHWKDQEMHSVGPLSSWKRNMLVFSIDQLSRRRSPWQLDPSPLSIEQAPRALLEASSNHEDLSEAGSTHCLYQAIEEITRKLELCQLDLP